MDAHYRENQIFTQYFASYFDYLQTAPLLYYADFKTVPPETSDAIRKAFAAGFEKDGWQALATDPYRAHLSDYGWGSNAIKANHGNMIMAGA